MSKLDDPCPHPSRDGRHELYGNVDGMYCRACGVSKEGRPLADVVHDEVRFDMPMQSTESDEMRILTADGYTFTEKPDGSIGDGDLSWPSMQAFIDSYKKGS